MKLNSVKKIQINNLQVEIYPDRQAMGRAAASAVTERIHLLLKAQDEIIMIFAAAPSQNEVLYELSKMEDVDWAKVTAFHMDEYIGLSVHEPQRFGNYLKERIFEKVPFKTVHYLNPLPGKVEVECNRYAELLQKAPIDIICMGIGENGHIAFNDPPVADFHDPKSVKVVELDQVCRQQQVNDGCFPSISEVPKQAITLTVPMLFSGKYLFVVVPGKTKAKAVYDMLNGDISTRCPASILRQHPDAILYLDKDSSGELSHL
ncbi:MAG: glucosamine-6-phosphate deaminase [Candidatus Marinimicrobia bacterium]|nr:glucosamine-6-phosphate deaminase [bacterium]MCG2716321.1 glucosamine-6-phosphate deaminase [Candidatus Neomarinimicrobiota bacterium]